jgi:hypothetical protein
VIVVKLENLAVATSGLLIFALIFALVIGYSGIVSGVGLVGSQSVPASGVIDYTQQNTTAGWLHTDGNKIYNSAGQVVALTGSCTAGLQGDYGVYWDSNPAQMHQLYDALEYYNASSVRIAINYQMMWASTHGGSHGYAAYMTTLDSIASYCETHNLWIIWDFHADYYNGQFYGNGGGTWIGPLQNDTWKNDKISQIQWFAKHFENYTSVIGIEILNEPSGFPGWDNPTDPTRKAYFDSYSTWCYNMAHAIHTVDSITAHYLVFVNEFQGSTTLHDWTDNGNKLLSEPNIVYVYHWYSWHFGKVTFDNEYAAGNYAEAKTDMQTYFQNRFWYLSSNYNVPIWFGEFGFWDGDDGGRPYEDQLIKDILQVHNDRGLSWSIWCWYVGLGESLIVSSTASPLSMTNWRGQIAVQYFEGASG